MKDLVLYTCAAALFVCVVVSNILLVDTLTKASASLECIETGMESRMGEISALNKLMLTRLALYVSRPGPAKSDPDEWPESLDAWSMSAKVAGGCWSDLYMDELFPLVGKGVVVTRSDSERIHDKLLECLNAEL